MDMGPLPTPPVMIQALANTVIVFLKDYAPGSKANLQQTGWTSYDQDRTPISFLRQFTEMKLSDGRTLGGKYVPGDVLDVVMTKAGRTYVASFFFSNRERKIHHRLARLAAPAHPPANDARLLESQTVGAITIDEGAIDWMGTIAESGALVTGWIQHQIDRDCNANSSDRKGESDGRRDGIVGQPQG